MLDNYSTKELLEELGKRCELLYYEEDSVKYLYTYGKFEPYVVSVEIESDIDSLTRIKVVRDICG